MEKNFDEKILERILEKKNREKILEKNVHFALFKNSLFYWMTFLYIIDPILNFLRIHWMALEYKTGPFSVKIYWITLLYIMGQEEFVGVIGFVWLVVVGFEF